jgi:hypothetical protein
MNLFDSSVEGWSPQTWNAQPWGMYGVPVPAGKKIDDLFKQLPVADLSESLDEMTFITTMLEKATGATPTQQGVATERQITLGEVQLALGEAKERIKGMSKFYTPAWKDRGTTFLKLIEAGSSKLDAVTVYKHGRNTDNIYSKEIAPGDWKSKSGYQTKVWSQDEKNTEDTNSLQKLSAAKANMPGNMKLEEIYQRKLVEFAGLNPEQTNEVMQAQTQLQQQLQQQMAMGMAPVGQPTRPVEPPPVKTAPTQ